jgi:hypothetical protein
MQQIVMVPFTVDGIIMLNKVFVTVVQQSQADKSLALTVNSCCTFMSSVSKTSSLGIAEESEC